MAWTLDDLEKLERAIKSGARVVEYEDEKVEYRNLDEMERIQNMIRRQLGLAPPAGNRRHFGSFSKGLE